VHSIDRVRQQSRSKNAAKPLHDLSPDQKNENARDGKPPGVLRFSTLFYVAAIGSK
jgi:hypothetical protein